MLPPTPNSPGSKSFVVTVYIVLHSAHDILASRHLTISALRDLVHNDAVAVLGDTGETVNKDSIFISSDLHGASEFSDMDLPLSSLLCNAPKIYAVVPMSNTNFTPPADAFSFRKGKINSFKLSSKLAAEQEVIGEGEIGQGEIESLRRDWEAKSSKDWEARMSVREKDLEFFYQTRFSVHESNWDARFSVHEARFSAREKDWEDRFTVREKARKARYSTHDKSVDVALAKNDKQRKVWQQKMELGQAELKAENVVLTALCNRLSEETDELAEELKRQVECQTRVEAGLNLLNAVVLRNLIDQAQA